MNYFSLKGLGYCTLHYDRKANKVGLQFVGAEDGQGVVKLSYRDVGAVIPSKSFLDYYQLSYNPSRQYLLEQDPESGLLVFDLGAPLEDGYLEHPDGRCAEYAVGALFSFLQEQEVELKPQQAAVLGRYLFETGAYLNFEQAAMETSLVDLFQRAKENTPRERPALPLEKKVFDLFRELL